MHLQSHSVLLFLQRPRQLPGLLLLALMQLLPRLHCSTPHQRLPPIQRMLPIRHLPLLQRLVLCRLQIRNPAHAHAGIDSTQGLSRTGVQEKAPGFHTHDSLIAVYVTFLRQKWRKAEDAGTWQDKHHRGAGATIFKWVHAIATEEENAILTRNRTDASGLSCPDVAKVQKNLEKLLIGVLYAVHKAHLPKAKMAAGLNYAGDFVQFWRNRKSIAKTTLQNTLDSIKSKLQTEPVKQRVFQDTDFSVPPKELIEQVRAEFATKRWLKDYISSHTGEGSPGKRRRQEEVAGAS